MVGLNKRVLVVDDEPLIRKLISVHLLAVGYVVRTAIDGLDGLAKLRAGPPELIISDLTMPRMSGPEFLVVVRKRFPQIPVIAISGLPTDEIPAGLAADAYCPKNEFLSEQLLQTMSDLARKLPLRTAPQSIDHDPVQARWDENGFYIIACVGCLREFRVPRVFHMGRDEKWATCVHCGNFVRFMVTEHSENK